MKTNYYLLFLVVCLIGCSKEENPPTTASSPPPSSTSNTSPTISVNLPQNNFSVNLGGSFSLEGIGLDSEGLSSINYSIESPTASYNYTVADNITASGTSYAFNESITIPSSASVGDALLKVYCTDTESSQSTIVSRNFKINVNYNPVITSLKDSVGGTDLTGIQVFKNSNNVVDSVVIVNITKSENITVIKDVGGFKSINCSVIENGFLGAPSNSSSQFFDLVSNFQNQYTYQLNESCTPPCNYYKLVIGFREYDNFADNTSTISSAYVTYDFIY